MGKYDDIIDLPHYRSPHRTPMPMENRGAQFAPFAALSGHDEAISETSRLTEGFAEPSDEEKFEISKTIREAYSNRNCMKIIHFIPDKSKGGGSYATSVGHISKVDEIDRLVILDNGLIIRMDYIKEAGI